jgi:hypothetical protein
LALEHHKGRVDYEWVEALGWERRDDEQNVTQVGHEWWYHWKAEELKRSSPGALVPTLIPVDEETGNPDESKVRWERDGSGRSIEPSFFVLKQLSYFFFFRVFMNPL